nr:hypothetical protein CFP56_70112 [Quercus suber]
MSRQSCYAGVSIARAERGPAGIDVSDDPADLYRLRLRSCSKCFGCFMYRYMSYSPSEIPGIGTTADRSGA